MSMSRKTLLSSFAFPLFVEIILICAILPMIYAKYTFFSKHIEKSQVVSSIVMYYIYIALVLLHWWWWQLVVAKSSRVANIHCIRTLGLLYSKVRVICYSRERRKNFGFSLLLSFFSLPILRTRYLANQFSVLTQFN